MQILQMQISPGSCRTHKDRNCLDHPRLRIDTLECVRLYSGSTRERICIKCIAIVCTRTCGSSFSLHRMCPADGDADLP